MNSQDLTIFRFLAFGALLAAIYHAIGAFGYLPHNHASMERHLTFVGINIVLSWYFLKRPKWMLPFYIIFCLEQTYGHGQRIIYEMHFLSIIVLITLYTGLWMILRRPST